MKAPLPTPASYFSPLPAPVREQILQALASGDADAQKWAEKTRRFASRYGRNLAAEVKARFGAEAVDYLNWIIELQLTGQEPKDHPPGADAAALNAACYCLDAGADAPHLRERIEKACEELQKWLCSTSSSALDTEVVGSPFDYTAGIWRREARNAPSVVLFCPSPFSLYTGSVLEICRRLSLPVEAIVLRRFTLKRIRHEWGRDGTRLIRKIWRKLILRGDENAASSQVSLASVHAALAPSHKDVRALARANGIPIIHADSFHLLSAEISALKSRFALFTGGGMVSEDVLGHFEQGMINIHMGCLPQYKGMDVVQAPILEGRFDSVGLTSHFMVPALDAGPAVSVFKTSSDHYSSIGALRNELSALFPFMAIDAYLGLSSGRLKAQAQQQSGRQYYVLNRRLESILAATLENRRVISQTPNSIERLCSTILRDIT